MSSDVVHVYPVGDVLEHDVESDGCLCGPQVEPVPRDDGSMGWLLTHHALDGREFAEPDYTGPPMVEETHG